MPMFILNSFKIIINIYHCFDDFINQIMFILIIRYGILLFMVWSAAAVSMRKRYLENFIIYYLTIFDV